MLWWLSIASSINRIDERFFEVHNVTRTFDSLLVSFGTSSFLKLSERKKKNEILVLISCSLSKNLDIIIFFITLFITAVAYVIIDSIKQFLILFSFITRLWSWWNLLLFARQFRERLTISVLLQDCDCRRISLFLFFSRLREKSSSSVCFLWLRNYQKKKNHESIAQYRESEINDSSITNSQRLFDVESLWRFFSEIRKIIESSENIKAESDHFETEEIQDSFVD